MSAGALLELPISAPNLAAVRTHARRVGELVGLESLQQTRFSTAVSEIARNAVQHAGGGLVTFSIEQASGEAQRLLAQISDHGPGIADVPAALEGRRRPDGRQPMGIVGSARLVDHLQIDAPATGGTRVRLAMALPRKVPIAPAELAALASQLAIRQPLSPFEELEHQNRELLRTLHELREKQTELERADSRKNQFVTVLAHELRNPLATLQMTLEILRRQPDIGAAELAQRREIMERQTGQLTQLVDDLLDAARVSQGKVTLQLAPTELNALVAQALEMCSGLVEARAHRVALQRSPTPLWVSADAPRLKQVFSNLLQNAARYTPSGGSITIGIWHDEGQAVVSISDNGIGISPALLPHVFGLFVQGDSGHANTDPGLGVGLALVRRLVQDHGGAVTAASPGADQGSTFTVCLPLQAAP